MYPTPLTAKKARSTTDLLGSDLSGPAQNTRSRSSSRATDRASIPGSYQESEADPDEMRQLQEPSTTPMPKPQAKGKDRHVPSVSSIDLSIHPFYNGSSSANPLPVVNNLEDLVRLLTKTTDGPKWYNFIRNMISYDVSNFEHYASVEAENSRLKARSDRYKSTARMLEERHDAIKDQLLENEERHTSTELQLEQARSTIDELRQRLEHTQTQKREPIVQPPPIPPRPPVSLFQHHDPKQANPSVQPAHLPQAVTFTHSAYPQQVKWKAMGSDPTEKLTGTNKQAYGPWAYSVKGKFRTDAPLYPSETHKTNYMINQLKEPIFQFMISWAETNENGTSQELFTEIEHYMGIHNQESDARKLLYEMTMEEQETVDEFYHKMFHLWTLAKIPEKERIDQFITSLRPYLSASITNMRFASVREAVDEVRLTETRKKVISDKYYKSNPKSNSSINKQKSSTPAVDSANEKFTPCAKKPAGWLGRWYEPEQRPKKLEQSEKWELTRQGRCWRCRGSGHKAGDENNGNQYCPVRKDKKVNVQKVEEVESSSEEEKA